ncbi:MAG: hypothetical protein V4550_08810 [Gemmatimonadota bacterium]
MTTDTSEKGLEPIIVRHMTGIDGLGVVPNRVAERPRRMRLWQHGRTMTGALD